MRRNLLTPLVALLVAVVIVAMMCAFQVRFTETAVVTRFEKITRVIGPDQAGLHFKLPWPIDRVHRYDARLRTFDTEFRQLGTKDQRTVILTAYATWRIVDAEKFLKVLGQEAAAVPKIRDLLENEVSNVLRTYSLGELVNVLPEEMRFEEIERKFLDGIRDDASKQYGVEVVTVGVKRLNLPESVTKEVFARMREDRQKTIKQLSAEGEAEAKKIRAQAEEVSKKILARAEAYAKTIEGQGDAEAAKYYRVFAENERLSSFLKKLETVRKIFEAGQITLVIDAKTMAPFDVLSEEGLTGDAGVAGGLNAGGRSASSQPAGAASGAASSGKISPAEMESAGQDARK